jgi:hypothetical protein
MRPDTTPQPRAASNDPFNVTSANGDVLTIPPNAYPTVLLRDGAGSPGSDILWTIRSAAAQGLFRYVREVGSEFRSTGFFHPVDRIWVPVLIFRISSGSTVAYTIGLVGQPEFPRFFQSFRDVDLLVTDTKIATRRTNMRVPVPEEIHLSMRRGALSFRLDPEQIGLIRKLERRAP